MHETLNSNGVQTEFWGFLLVSVYHHRGGKRQSGQGSEQSLPMGTAPLLAKYGGAKGFRRMVSHVSKPLGQIKSYSPKKNHKLPGLSSHPHTYILQDILIFNLLPSIQKSSSQCFVLLFFKEVSREWKPFGYGDNFQITTNLKRLCGWYQIVYMEQTPIIFLREMRKRNESSSACLLLRGSEL